MVITLKQIYHATQGAHYFKPDGSCYFAAEAQSQFLNLYMRAKGKKKLSGNGSIQKLNTKNATLIEKCGCSKLLKRGCLYIVDYGFEGLQFITFDLEVAREELDSAYEYGRKGW